MYRKRDKINDHAFIRWLNFANMSKFQLFVFLISIEFISIHMAKYLPYHVKTFLPWRKHFHQVENFTPYGENFLSRIKKTFLPGRTCMFKMIKFLLFQINLVKARSQNHKHHPKIKAMAKVCQPKIPEKVQHPNKEKMKIKRNAIVKNLE